MTGVRAAKAELRARLLAARAARTSEQLHRDRAAIRAHVLRHAAGQRVVAAYVPLRTEPGSTELLAELRAAGADVIVPVMQADRDLDWAPWQPDGLGAPLGLAAISAAGLVLVPALAVAADGTRLGRGGGSYDRALARCAPAAMVTALLFDRETVAELPRDEWDVPVGAVVTPSGWFEVGGIPL